MADTTDTPIGDQVASEVNTDDVAAEGTFTAADGSERPRYGFHDGRFYVTFTVSGGVPLDDTQLADCAGNVRLHAVNSGYVATDTSHDVVTQTSEDGKVARVIVSVPVRENRVVDAADEG